MKLYKFEKLSFIESRNESKIDFKNKYDTFIKILYSKLLKKKIKKNSILILIIILIFKKNVNKNNIIRN